MWYSEYLQNIYTNYVCADMWIFDCRKCISGIVSEGLHTGRVAECDRFLGVHYE